MLRTLQEYANRVCYFVMPFLLVAGVIFWENLRLAQPDEAMKTARQYLEGQFPGLRWEPMRIMMVGESLGKKWRLELTSSRSDGRMIQANLLVDRWQPGHLVGKFVLLHNPPQILDGGWENPSFLERVSGKISRVTFFLAGIFFLVLQSFWLYRIHLRVEFRKLDGLVLVFLGAALLLNFMVVEVHPAFVGAYAAIFTALGLFAISSGGKGSA